MRLTDAVSAPTWPEAARDLVRGWRAVPQLP
jgi:hypothetical protein